ncbi:MAG: CotH kinase family protein [Draconibacterium sp.]|nr:CotH kinase family protein [Draconibacterium sp.]
MFPKKSYSVETRFSNGSNNSVSLLGLPKENDWVLHGPYSDKSLMRNALAYSIGNAMGNSWHPRTRFVEVEINGEYRGVYLFVEKIKIDKNRVDIATLKPEDNSGDELTGGYIISIDRDQEGSWNSPFYGRTGSVDVPFSYVDPKYEDLTAQQRNYIKSHIIDFEYALHGNDFKDPDLGYRAYIDVESFIDYFIITELSRNLDGYRVSVYFHKDKDSKGGKLTMSPFWDYNICFGNANFFSAGNTVGWASDGIGAGDWYEIPFWWDRFREDPYFETLLKYRWEKLRKNVISKNTINYFIDSCQNVLNEAQVRNFEKFNVLNTYVWPNNYIGGTYANEVNYLKTWISSRLDWIDTQIDKIEPAFVVSNHEITTSDIFEPKIYPNPFSDKFVIEFDSQTHGEVDISVKNLLGQLVCRKTVTAVPGRQAIEFTYNELGQNGNAFIYSILKEGNQVKSGIILHK